MTFRMPRMIGAAAAALVLLASAAPARAQEPEAEEADTANAFEGAEIVEVRFSGATRMAPEQLASAIRTRETRCTLALPLRPLCWWFGWGVDEHRLDRQTLAADELRLRLFYYERGFRTATVRARVEPVEDGVDVIFDVEEGRPVRVGSIGFAGEAERVAPVLKPGTPLREGMPLDLLRLQEARDSLQSRLRDRGYARAEVLAGYLIPTDSPLVARVTFDVFPGTLARFGAVRVVGDTTVVSPSLVRRMLTFAPGDRYREADIVASQRQIYALEVFTHASIEPHPDSASGDSIPVTVSVNVGDVHRVRLGLGLNSLDCVNAEGRWVSRSFLGGARRLELRGRVANVLSEQLRYGEFNVPCSSSGTGEPFGTLNGSVNVDFVQPWFLGARNALGAGLALERRSVPGVFVRDSRGGYVSFSRQLNARTTGSIAYRPALTSFVGADDPFFCVSFLACDAVSVELLREPNWLAPVGLSLVHDASNSLFSPTRGYVVRFDGEVASRYTGSAFQYVRLTGEAAWYQAMPGDVVVAAHVRPGWARAVGHIVGEDDLGLHPQRRFFAGGPNSVRGFAQSRLGPKILAVNGRVLADTADGGPGCAASTINNGSCDAQALAPGAFEPRPTGGTVLLEGNLELRFPLIGPLRGVAFIDAGQVWNDELDPATIAWSPGLGLRYFSPIGPIRVDVGYNTSGAELLPVRATGVVVCFAEDGPDADDDLDEITPCVDPDPGTYYRPELLENTNELVDLAPVNWDPRGDRTNIFDRIQIHFSIGQAF